MTKNRTKTEQANIDLNKVLDGDNRNELDTNRLTNTNQTKTEEANIKLNNELHGENPDKLNTASLINNNQISLVLSNKKDKEDDGIGK